MPQLRLTDRLKEHLKTAEGREVTIDDLRKELQIDPASSNWNSIRQIMINLSEKKIVKPTGRKDGSYKVIKQVKPVTISGRKRKEPLKINFPRDYFTMKEMLFAQDIVLREGDMILISGRSNYGKTGLCLNFCAENLESYPTLMGNEYTTIDGEPSPRFLTRIDSIDWVDWENGTGDRFELLPVRDDYAEHVQKDKINIIDWINLEEHYMISKVMEDIKRELGKGIAIIAIQKAEGAEAGRGGQFTKDFADVELLIDKYKEGEILLKIGKVKEYRKTVSDRTFAYSLQDGVRVSNFREVYKCKICNGSGYRFQKPCTECDSGYNEGVKC